MIRGLAAAASGGIPPVDAARELLGCELTADLPPGPVTVRIVEVEAYGTPADGRYPDPASHCCRGRTPRNAVMFGRPGLLYVYRSYGIHLCANISVGPQGQGGAVLLRGAEIVSGAHVVGERRGGVPARVAARGPGNLGSALGIGLEHNGIDVFDERSPITLASGARVSDALVASGPRVGVSAGATRPWRLWITGSPAVSAYRKGAVKGRRQRQTTVAPEAPTAQVPADR
ncbi:DNA-3-methyladenine glycosylase [Gordonia jinhuaensis]|uniref:Putative 3-methyladenine DNA glycosylase n=1 Tax=Gordonia jinhuaensis TaxID=1517702 RepID=A0A916WYP1_9ACTN|nr:DNA-3-methyladenine glycosylase [Gordonia jinhuaensis]GGB42767.1 putative 3-methyladenine DNA glycosylase [Gordonia jinhuaensis]